MRSADVAVIGAGISGAAAAFRLAEAGVGVVLIDRHGPAAMASGWSLAGVRQSGRHPAELPLVRHAVTLWPTLAEELGAPTHYRQKGNLRLARNEAEIGLIRDLVARQSALGLDLQMLADTADVRAVAPALSDRVMAASFCPTDGHADPVATVTAFVSAAERRGAELLSGVAVERFDVVDGTLVALQTSTGRICLDHCILATGIETNALLRPLGLEIPFDIRMVTALLSTPMPAMLDQVLGVANADCAARQQVDGRLRFTGGGTAWHGVLDTSAPGRPAVAPTAGSLAQAVANVANVLPGTGQAGIERVWAGLLDVTPDEIPVIDHVPGVDGLIVAAGFSGHGFALGPVTGEILRDLVLGRKIDLSIEPFAFDRPGLKQPFSSSALLYG